MKDLAGKVAVVTGGGSGIGRALCLAFAAEGMKVAVADVEQAAADAVAAEVAATGGTAIPVRVDVSDRASTETLAEVVDRELGGCDLLCNNAGVLSFKHASETTASDWDWQLGVNLYGVVNGLLAFLPRMLAAGRGGHIVNTASIAGMRALGGTSGLLAYTTTKYGVVGLSEALAGDLAEAGIGVSVLCPGGVSTRIIEAGRNRPDRFGGPEEARRPAGAGGGLQTAMDPADVAALVVRAVKEDQLHVFTHPETRPLVEERCRTLMAAFDWLETARRR
jgi:NAD(P)-dependent dehydrogenase (short-subunit alcohol dehydrogenase family)